MASLFNNRIDQTYQGLIKTVDNGPISATPSRLSDGVGNTMSIQISKDSVIFDGIVDLTGASSAKLTFAIAAAQYTDLNVTSNNWDTLQIFVSSDCSWSASSITRVPFHLSVNLNIGADVAAPEHIIGL